jgi:hypothetical protein
MRWDDNEVADFFEDSWELIGSTKCTPLLLYSCRCFLSFQR